MERDTEWERFGQRVHSLRVELPEQLPGQRRATAATRGARQSPDCARGSRLQMKPDVQADPFNPGEGTGWVEASSALNHLQILQNALS